VTYACGPRWRYRDHRTEPAGRDGTLDERLADPDGAAAILEAIGTDPDGRPRGILAASSRPCSATSPAQPTFPGIGLDQAAVVGLALRYRSAGQAESPIRCSHATQSAGSTTHDPERLHYRC